MHPARSAFLKRRLGLCDGERPAAWYGAGRAAASPGHRDVGDEMERRACEGRLRRPRPLGVAGRCHGPGGTARHGTGGCGGDELPGPGRGGRVGGILPERARPGPHPQDVHPRGLPVFSVSEVPRFPPTRWGGSGPINATCARTGALQQARARSRGKQRDQLFSLVAGRNETMTPLLSLWFLGGRVANPVPLLDFTQAASAHQPSAVRSKMISLFQTSST
ncbi:unnamed protein product [Diplocarpon coronariae]